MLAPITSIQYYTGNSSQCNKARKGYKDWKGKVKLLLYVDPKGSSKAIRPIGVATKRIAHISGYKVHIQKSIVFLYIICNNSGKRKFKSLFINL